ncbi:MAG: hypothetical protein JWN23_255 [Rhodocyclales bacterium]|nr:hypothetical protein [Rhodocyclales bacterium]
MSETKNDFLSAAEAWLCDGYALDVRYVSRPTTEGRNLISAFIGMNPLESPKDYSLDIATDNIVAGQIQQFPVGKRELIQVLNEATQGRIVIAGSAQKLIGSQPYDYHSEMTHRDRWFSELHIQVIGGRVPMPSTEVLARIDNDLRASSHPFDGLSDLNNWLGTDAAVLNGEAPTIVVRVAPPVDLILDRCQLRENELTLVLHAHPTFDTNRIGLAVRGTPDDGLSSRQQVASLIEWGAVTNNRRAGIVHLQLHNCENALAILMIGPSTVRRQWFLDPTKARNNRYMAVQCFDTDLRRIRGALLESPEATKFEQGIAALLFLLGFSPVLQLETNSPDLIVTTPAGRLVLVECTIKTSDFSAKLGKLVDRRGALSKVLVGAGHQPDILAVLVCRLPRDQIAAHENEPQSHQVLLWAQEELNSNLDRVRHPSDPDKMVEAAKAALEPKEGDLFGA